MKKKPFPIDGVYALLEPGPVVLLSTAHKGHINVMTLSWHMMVEFEPPLLACVLSPADFSFAALRKTRECVINIPTVDLSAAVVGCGNTSGRDVDKFDAFGLTASPGSIVAAPLIAECFASLECRVRDTREVNRYGMFILEVVAAWVDRSVSDPRTLHHRGYGAFMVAGETFQLPSRMR